MELRARNRALVNHRSDGLAVFPCCGTSFLICRLSLGVSALDKPAVFSSTARGSSGADPLRWMGIGAAERSGDRGRSRETKAAGPGAARLCPWLAHGRALSLRKGGLLRRAPGKGPEIPRQAPSQAGDG